MKKMLKLKYFMFIVIFTLGVNLQAQDILGQWQTINEDTGKPNSLIEIYEEDGEVKGKVLKILKEENRGQICSNCTVTKFSKRLPRSLISSTAYVR